MKIVTLDCDNPCDAWSEENLLISRINKVVRWHAYEKDNRAFDKVLADGTHLNRDAENHRQTEILLRDLAMYLDRAAKIC